MTLAQVPSPWQGNFFGRATYVLAITMIAQMMAISTAAIGQFMRPPSGYRLPGSKRDDRFPSSHPP